MNFVMQKYTILIVGGAGYIGSHMVKMLALDGHRVIVLDNLSTGFRHSARFGEKLIVGDLADKALLDQIFSDNKYDAVMHFAAASLVGESIQNPAKYYRNNVSNTLNLLEVMVKHHVLNIVFSSTAAIFGEPVYAPINENHPKNPINPYGASKLMIERILEDYSVAYGLNSISLRYFNACGADPEGDLGEMHEPETHLIPLVLQAAAGRRENIKIFGTDYPTADGTCIRDYIHVVDLCDAHKLAINKLLIERQKGADVFNLGNGNGFSVREIINRAIDITTQDQREIEVIEVERRPGDPAVLVADSVKANEKLGYKPKYSDINMIISHAWEFEKNYR